MRRIPVGLNLCVLASGAGSNLGAIIKAQTKGNIRSRVKLVICNNSASGALKTAQRNNIPAYHLSQKNFNSEKKFVDSFLGLLTKHKIDLIVLAGYMKMLSPEIIRKYHSKIINIHPALLPSFGGKGMFGMNVHKAVIDFGAKLTGISVHLVDEEYDHGAVILQKAIYVKEEDTPETLRARVLRAEHANYYKAIKLFEEGKIKVHGRKAIVQK